MENFFNNLLEFFFIVAGLMFLYSAYKAFGDETNPKKVGTSIFWAALAVIFIFGRWLPPIVSGILVIVLGLITLFNRFSGTGRYKADITFAEKSVEKRGNKIFIPVVVMALSAILISRVFPESSRTVIGIGATLSLIIAMILFKASPKEVLEETDRMVQQVGTTSILPQLLAALGVVFVSAGVGEIVSDLVGQIFPVGSHLMGSIAYVLGMFIFTIIMGNAFAAFTVITAGIGIPFVLTQGADPVIAGALAMTAGYCGTLLTPMAGNFNILPVALLEIKDEYKIIKAQAPVALVLLVVHIVLMYFWAF